MVIAALCCFAFIAGLIDAMVGGGGLIQLPAMFILQPGLGLAQTLATNKTASFFGTSVAAFQYARKVELDWKKLAPAIVAAFVGAFSGALLVSYVHKEQFMPVIICVLLLVLAYTIVKKDFGLNHQVKSMPLSRHILLGTLTGLIIGFYDGLIGPGTGSFLMFAFVIVFGYDFLHASANAKFINCVTNIAALIFFFAKGYIIWSVAVPVGIANMLGNYTGSHIAMKNGSVFLRVFFIVVVLILIVKLSVDYL